MLIFVKCYTLADCQRATSWPCIKLYPLKWHLVKNWAHLSPLLLEVNGSFYSSRHPKWAKIIWWMNRRERTIIMSFLLFAQGDRLKAIFIKEGFLHVTNFLKAYFLFKKQKTKWTKSSIQTKWLSRVLGTCKEIGGRNPATRSYNGCRLAPCLVLHP